VIRGPVLRVGLVLHEATALNGRDLSGNRIRDAGGSRLTRRREDGATVTRRGDWSRGSPSE
jgi:hypothetical protein